MANNIYENPNFPQRRNLGGGITAYVPQFIAAHNVAGKIVCFDFITATHIFCHQVELLFVFQLTTRSSGTLNFQLIFPTTTSMTASWLQ